MKRQGRCSPAWYFVSSGIGIFLTFLGFLFAFVVFPDIFKGKLEEKLVLRNGTELTKFFIKAPPATISIYVYNVTNKDDVNKKGSRAILQQLGPYVYSQEKVKEVIEWDEDHGVVKYRERTTFFFQPNRTKGSLSDVVNHVNVLSITLKEVLQLKGFSVLTPIIGGDYIETHTVEQLLFKGYSMQPYIPAIIPASVCRLLNNCTFGLYYGKNETISEVFEVSTGAQGMERYTEIITYNGAKELSCWYGKECNDIKGTDGRQFPPGVTKHRTPEVFTSELKISLAFQYEKKTDVEGISALRFIVPETAMADPNKFKGKMCYCQPPSNEACPSKAGILKLSPCLKGAPIVASSPHFYMGEREYSEKYSGLRPNKDEHESYLDIEPFTGGVIAGLKRLQLNIDVVPDDSLACLEHVNESTYFPILWAQEGGRIDPESAEKFRAKVFGPYNTVKYSSIAVSLIGLLTLIITALVYGKKERKWFEYAVVVKEDPDLALAKVPPKESEKDVHAYC